MDSMGRINQSFKMFFFLSPKKFDGTPDVVQQILTFGK